MPLHLGAPKLPKSDNKSEVYNTSFTHGSNPVFMSPGMPNSTASTADLELYRKRREAAIARGEDPDAAAKARDAKHEARKDKVKGLFGMKSESSKGPAMLPNEGSQKGELQEEGVRKESVKGADMPKKDFQEEGLQKETLPANASHDEDTHASKKKTPRLHSEKIISAAVAALGSLGGAS